MAVLRSNADVYIDGPESDPEEVSAVMPVVLVPEVDRVLRTAGEWQFNAFKLAETTSQAPLSTLCFWVLQTQGLIREFGVPLPTTLLLGLQHHSCISSGLAALLQ